MVLGCEEELELALVVLPCFEDENVLFRSDLALLNVEVERVDAASECEFWYGELILGTIEVFCIVRLIVWCLWGTRQKGILIAVCKKGGIGGRAGFETRSLQ